MSVGDEVSAVVRLTTESRTYSIPDTSSGTEVTIVPRWISDQIWKGEKPPELGRRIPTEPKEQEIIIDNVPGKIVFNQMKSGTGRTDIILLSYSRRGKFQVEIWPNYLTLRVTSGPNQKRYRF